MLREDKAAGWSTHGLWPFKRHVFVTGKRRAAKAIAPTMLASMHRQQLTAALRVLADGPRSWWWCLDRFYVEDEGLPADDVYALAYERRLRAQRKLERARSTLATGQLPSTRRQPIPREVRIAVFERDRGRCVECEATFDLQFDHLIPIAMGGATTEQNLQLLCGGCNREKGATLG